MLYLAAKRFSQLWGLRALVSTRSRAEEKTPQMKRYEPAWLAGTSVGDIMFQASFCHVTSCDVRR